MGIAGLLPQLKSVVQRKHLNDFRGKTIAVDAFCWLHRGALSCPKDIVEGTYTTRYVDFCMRQVQTLQHAGIKPVVVFDGAALPAKEGENAERRRCREEAREKALAFAQSGNDHAAYEWFAKAVNISDDVAHRFVVALRAAKVEYVIAPYEADAQMAYLAKQGLVDAVLTEDSDLLAYGCPLVLFKMDKAGGVQAIAFEDLENCKGLDLKGFSPEMFMQMCVLFGCDFLPSGKGVGPKTAHAAMKKTRSWVKACKHLRFNGIALPRGYEASFQRAIWTFRHQRIYCPKRQRIAHVTDIPEGGMVPDPELSTVSIPDDAAALLDPSDTSFLGPEIPEEHVQALVRGDISPKTREPFAEDAKPPPTQSGSAQRHTGSQPGQSGSALWNSRSTQPSQSGGKLAQPKAHAQRAGLTKSASGRGGDIRNMFKPQVSRPAQAMPSTGSLRGTSGAAGPSWARSSAPSGGSLQHPLSEAGRHTPERTRSPSPEVVSPPRKNPLAVDMTGTRVNSKFFGAKAEANGAAPAMHIANVGRKLTHTSLIHQMRKPGHGPARHAVRGQGVGGAAAAPATGLSAIAQQAVSKAVGLKNVREALAEGGGNLDGPPTKSRRVDGGGSEQPAPGGGVQLDLKQFICGSVPKD
ncbi:unnamed protein product [Pedinophyceae sp. YPF-701]|nr:unnamed protein product [Pedinophyceae sp. YPF-701]